MTIIDFIWRSFAKDKIVNTYSNKLN